MQQRTASDDDTALEFEGRLGRETWHGFVNALTSFITSEVGGKATVLLVGLLALMLSINGLNVLSSYVARSFMTAIERRDHDKFLWQAALYIGVFGVSTIAAVLFKFLEERLGLLWRHWLTRTLVISYLGDRTYQRLSRDGLANPDQRIAEDVKTFVTMTLSLLLMALNSTLTALAFSGVLWSISPTLFLVGIAYAAAGSVLTYLLGRPLILLNYVQSDREADLRTDLIHVRGHADSVALLRRERQLKARLFGRIDALVKNMKRIIAVNRNVGFFTTGYNYLVQLIPALIVAPLFMQGAADFGVITQSALAFTYLLGAFSLIITQFAVISSYAAVLARLTGLIEGTRRTKAARKTGIEVVEAGDRLAWEHLTLHGGHGPLLALLVHDLSVAIPAGSRLLIRGDNAAAAVLFRATAGIWESGEGRIVRPGLDDGIVFLPERPYLAPGTLREALAGGAHADASDDRILDALRALGVENVVTRAGGLDVERDWAAVLSLREQQLVSIAGILLEDTRFALFERIGSTLEADRIGYVLRVLSERGITCVTIGADDTELDQYDAVLDLKGDGHWSWKSVRHDKVHSP